MMILYHYSRLSAQCQENYSVFRNTEEKDDNMKDMDLMSRDEIISEILETLKRIDKKIASERTVSDAENKIISGSSSIQ
jgi:hypothetical protein